MIVVFRYEWRGEGRLFIYPEGCFVTDSSVSSSYMVPNFPCMLFSYLFTTSSPLTILILRKYWVFWEIFLIVPVPSAEFSAHTSNRCSLSSLDVTRGFGDDGRNF